MGLTSLGLEIGIFSDFLYSVLLFNANSGLDFLGRPLFRPQVGWEEEVVRRLPPEGIGTRRVEYNDGDNCQRKAKAGGKLVFR